MSILGTRVLRTEDPGFLTTGAVYTEDVQDERLAGACYVHFVRSTVAHAKISSIDISAAQEADGVVAVYTGKDLADGGARPVQADDAEHEPGDARSRCSPPTWCGSSASRSRP